jgi:hypothetical protein
VIVDDFGVYHLYYTSLSSPFTGQRPGGLCHIVSADGRHWSGPTVVQYGSVRSPRDGLYTSEAFQLGPYICLLTTAQQSVESWGEELLFSRDGRQFYEVVSNPVAISPMREPSRWDSRRYGWDILQDSGSPDGKWRVYFIGIRSDSELGGQIGIAQISPKDLLDRIDETLKLLARPETQP